MAADALRRSVEGAIVPIMASFGAWGIEGGRFEQHPDHGSVLWLRTRTEIERVILQSQIWMEPQVHVILARLGVPYAEVSRIRLDFESAETPRSS